MENENYDNQPTDIDAKFEQWAIVELFGHQKIAGLVSEQQLGGASFIRVDVPETSVNPAFTRTLNPSAVYAFNWTTKEVATKYAEQLRAKPVTIFDIKKAV